MNYRSQLKGWAVDRAIELAKVGFPIKSMDDLKSLSDELTVYCYVPDKDFKDTIAYVSQLLKESTDPLDKITQMQGELAVIQEEIERQLAAHAANKPNGQAQEVLQ